MNLEFRSLQELSDEQAKAVYGWLMDAENRFFTTLCRGPDDKPIHSCWQDLQEKWAKSKATRYGVFLGEEFVGEFNFVFDHPALLKNEPKTAWIGVGIGKETSRRMGVGTKVMSFIEEQIKAQGGKRIEFGAFEYNEPAIRFYKKLGYQHFETVKNETWWEGKWWSGLRFERLL